jgi:hypothetical protein
MPCTPDTGFEVLAIAIINKRVQPIDTFDNHIAAATAIAAVRAAKFNIFLAPKRHAARPAIAGANINLRLVEKFHCLILWLQISGICRKTKSPQNKKGDDVPVISLNSYDRLFGQSS